MKKNSIKQIADIHSFIATIRQNRNTAATILNGKSSRSHMMIKISMSSGTNNDHTHMIFVDLAGFEPIGSNDIKSTKFINSILLCRP